jgi:epoxyqueuosine reductase
MTTTGLTEYVRNEALRLGFLDCGFARVRHLSEHENFYLEWLRKGNHASMEYMERNIDKRLNPALLVEGARSVVVFLHSYYPEKELRTKYKIARYAYGEDYHDVLKDKLRPIADGIAQHVPNVNQRIFTDSAPVLERAWAHEAGLGWFGKNSSLIHRKYGSFFFIAVLITSAEFDYNSPFCGNYCGNCTACINACPTKAILTNRTINSRRCISYQTIENRGEMPFELKGKFAQNIFGCDICQEVCPWNKRSMIHNEPHFMPSNELSQLTDKALEQMTETAFKQIFRKSAIKRTKFEGLKRNISFLDTTNNRDKE